MAEIHWVGGNLPQVGKSWAVRALTESLFFANPHVAPIVVDTSPDSFLSEVYNPALLQSHTPSQYFSGNCLAADEIFKLVHTHKVLVIKLASHTQSAFLDWVQDSNVENDDIRHKFWFVSNGHRHRPNTLTNYVLTTGIFTGSGINTQECGEIWRKQIPLKFAISQA